MAAAANLQITADGTVDIDSAGVLTLDSGAAINIEPASGSAILLDGTISVDAGVVTGATSVTSTAFVGNLTGTVATATQNSITTATGLVSVGALDSGSITSGFGTIDTGSSNITTTGVGAFGSLDISGNIDVDGTTNLDAVDIDGDTDMAGALQVTGGATFDNGTSSLKIRYESGGTYIQLGTDEYLRFINDNGSTEVLRLVDGGDINIAAGDLVFGTAGKGICLGATSNTDANTLDDYEEGTHVTDADDITSGSITINGSQNTFSYTKIGRQVTITGEINVSSVSSPSSMRLSLPFTIAANTIEIIVLDLNHQVTMCLMLLVKPHK